MKRTRVEISIFDLDVPESELAQAIRIEERHLLGTIVLRGTDYKMIRELAALSRFRDVVGREPEGYEELEQYFRI